MASYASIFGNFEGKDWADIVDENVEADILRIKKEQLEQQKVKAAPLPVAAPSAPSAPSAASELDLLAESSRDGINLLFKKAVGVNDKQGGAISFGSNYFGAAFPSGASAASKPTGNVWADRKQQHTASQAPIQDNSQRRIGKRSSSALYADATSSGALGPVLEEEEDDIASNARDSIMSMAQTEVVTPDKETPSTVISSIVSPPSIPTAVSAAPQAPSKTVTKNLSFAGILKGLKPTAATPSEPAAISSLAPISINHSSSGSLGNGGIEKKRRVGDDKSLIGANPPSSPSPSPVVSIVNDATIKPVAVFSSFESFSEAFFKQGAAISNGGASDLSSLSAAQIESGVSVRVAIGSASLSISLPSALAGGESSVATSDMDGDSVTPASAMDASMMTTSMVSGEIEELTEARIANRQRDIDFGKAIPGYSNYLAAVPAEKRAPRNPVHPQTPDKYELMGKRRWQGLVKAWKKGLHAWDAVDPSLMTLPAIAPVEVSQKASALTITVGEGGERTVKSE